MSEDCRPFAEQLTFSKSDVSQLLVVTELLQLTNLGICISDVCWSKVRMTSGDWICIRRAVERNYSDLTISKRNLAADHRKLTVLTLLNPYDNHIESFECCLINSAQVNPVKKVIALTSFANTLHVICLDSNVCIASTHLPPETQFWTWVDETNIGIVTSLAVYHWNFEDEHKSLKLIFNRSERLADCQVTNYEIDESKSWCALSCLYLDKETNTVCGIVQIYSVQYNQFQCIEAHCVRFSNYSFDERKGEISTVLIAAKRLSRSFFKIFIVELPNEKCQNYSLITKSELISWPQSLSNDDFPVCIVCNDQFGFVYIFSKYGCVTVFDMEVGCCLFEKYGFCSDVVFKATLDRETQGVIVISRNGQVLSVELNVQPLLDNRRHSIEEITRL